MAREALAITGLVIGAAVGGPAGAQIGFAIGYGIGSYIDPMTIPGPKPGEAPVQTSRAGVPSPIIWGVHHCHGNLIQAGPIDEVEEKERQGKSKITYTKRYRTFAIRVCDGPISGISRIWEYDRLVVDLRNDPAIPIEETNKYLEGLTIYYGTADQMPDPDLELIKGAGLQPAHRDTAYIVWKKHDVTDSLGAIPQFRFEVNGSADHAATSHPYPVHVTEGLQPVFEVLDTGGLDVEKDGFNVTFGVLGISIEPSLTATDIPTEGFDTLFSVFGINLQPVLESTSIGPEGLDNNFTVTGIELQPVVVAYTMEPEGFDNTFAITGITLT